MKKIIPFFCILFFLFFLYSSFNYDLKIELEIKNKNPYETDKYIAANIEEELQKIKELKDISIFSSMLGCNIYCKFNFFSNKETVINKIQRKINSLGFLNYKINDKYFLKYNYFIIITNPKNNYYALKEKADKITNELLKLKFINNIKIFGTQQKTNYIYFSSSDLLNYDITIEELRNIIKNNNIKKNFIHDSNFYYTSINNHIKNIEDIKKIPLRFKNSNFSTTFDEIFDIKKDIEYPIKNKIIYNNKEAIVIALSTNFWLSKTLLKIILKEYNVEIINPKYKQKIKIYLNENSSTQNSLNWLIEKNLNGLFFIGLKPPKTTDFETFDEIIQNRIIGFIDKKEKKNINFYEKNIPQELQGFEYDIHNHKLSTYNLDKQELTNSILANEEGLFCDYYTDKKDKINIVLKSKDNFIYSKKYKTLVPLEEVTNKKIKKHQIIIYRKNGKINKIKNPCN